MPKIKNYQIESQSPPPGKLFQISFWGDPKSSSKVARICGIKLLNIFINYILKIKLIDINKLIIFKI
jgi:hypothetical protein